MEKRLFADQTAVVTGGGQGIGRAAAETPRPEGAHVYIAEQDEEAGTECEEEIRKAGGAATFVPTDVARPEEIRRLMDRIGKERANCTSCATTRGSAFSAHWRSSPWKSGTG